MRQAPRRSAGHAATHPVQPLKGLPGTRAAFVSYRASVPAGHAGRGVALSYRALAPGGAGFCYRICTGASVSRLTAHYSLLTANSTYTFSAKEKDVETGLSYFGSRYYSSDLSVWLSVDPMCDKYLYQSGYVYCGNNPIKIIDPNGEDEWDLGKDGTLSQRANGRTDVDIVHAKDKNGKDVERYYNAGSINYNAQCNEKYDEEVGWYTVDVMEFADSETATGFFEFAANYSNVEWGLKIAPDKNVVGTCHDQGFVKIDPPKGMTCDIHSHVDNPNKYIGSDHLRAESAYYKGITYKVYEVGKQSYATYNPTFSMLNGPREISLLLAKKINLLKMLSR